VCGTFLVKLFVGSLLAMFGLHKQHGRVPVEDPAVLLVVRR